MGRCRPGWAGAGQSGVGRMVRLGSGFGNEGCGPGCLPAASAAHLGIHPRHRAHRAEPLRGVSSSGPVSPVQLVELHRRQEACETNPRVVLDYNQSLLQENPKNGMAHAKIGNALLFLGESPSALPHLRKAATLISDYAQVHYDLGSVYLRQNELELARREFETVLRLNPTDYQAHGNLGYIYLRTRDPDRAALHFERAIEINPDDPLAHKNLEIARRARSLLRSKP